MNWLLISDLDSTWVGDQIALEKLQQQLSDHRDSLYLVYATGRSFASAKALQQEVGLMEPNYWVTAVGSEIYHADGLDLAWADYLSENWQRDTIQAIADRIAYHKDLDESVGKFLALMVEQGATVTEVDAAFRKQWADGMDNVARLWADQLDGDGKSGSAVLSAYMDTMRAAGATPVRDWDRE